MPSCAKLCPAVPSCAGSGASVAFGALWSRLAGLPHPQDPVETQEQRSNDICQFQLPDLSKRGYNMLQLNPRVCGGLSVYQMIYHQFPCQDVRKLIAASSPLLDNPSFFFVNFCTGTRYRYAQTFTGYHQRLGT